MVKVFLCFFLLKEYISVAPWSSIVIWLAVLKYITIIYDRNWSTLLITNKKQLI